ATRRPTGDDRDDDLRHEPNQALHLEDVQPPGRPRRGLSSARRSRTPIETVPVLIPALAAHALVAARAERPSTVFRARAVAREKHDSDRAVEAGVVEGAGEFIH